MQRYRDVTDVPLDGCRIGGWWTCGDVPLTSDVDGSIITVDVSFDALGEHHTHNLRM